MNRNRITICIYALTLAMSFIAADPVPIFAAAETELMVGEETQVIGGNPVSEASVCTEDTETEAITATGDITEPQTITKTENVTETGDITEPEATTETEDIDSAEPESITETEDIDHTESGDITEPESTAETGPTVKEKPGSETETSDDLIYVEDALYSGPYIDGTGIMYMVSEGIAEPINGILNKNTKYYRCDEAGVMTPMTLPQQTLYVNGKAYTGHYLSNEGKMYSAQNGTLTLKIGTMKKGAVYYSALSKKTRTLPRQTLYVEGKAYTGHYLSRADKMYSVKNGTSTLKTGTVTDYYDHARQKAQTFSKAMLYVKGKCYTGHYQDRSKKMYTAKNGKYTLKTGTLKKGTKYFSYSAKKLRKLSKENLYVKGTVYTGHYLSRTDKMYTVKKGTKTLKNGIINKGKKYYSYRSKKKKTLSQKTIYVNGKSMKGMSAASMETLARAQAIVARVTNDRMTKQQKLKACFDFVKTYSECNPRLPHYRGMDWPVIYANDMFINGTGNCCSYGAAFAYMAKAIGYEEVYCCNSGGHGWAEIDGLVYDPEWSIHYHVYNYYALSYDTRTDQNYKGAIAARLPWMHIKI